MFLMKILSAPLLIPLLVLPALVNGQRLDALLSLRPELSLFVDSIGYFPELQILLNDSSLEITVFAPSNDALQDNSRFKNPLDWIVHLNETMRSHFVVGTFLSSDSLSERESIRVLAGHYLQVYGPGVLEDSNLVNPDLQATNGVVHVIDNALPAPFDKYSLSDLDRYSEFLPPNADDAVSLVQVVDSLPGARDFLGQNFDEGATFLGCEARALQNIDADYSQRVNNAPTVLKGELLNASRPSQEVMHQFVEYNTLLQNFYYDVVTEGAVALALPAGKCGAMWVSKRNGKLCFNDACVLDEPQLRTYNARNGVGYILDKCLLCSSVAMLLQYANDVTDLDVKDTSRFLQLSASELNLRNLSQSVGMGGPITLFASIQSGWDTFDVAEVARLNSDAWIAHRLDLLKNMMVQGEYHAIDLYRIFQEEGGPYNLTTLNGDPLLVDYEPSDDLLKIGGGDFYVANVRGIDGIMHLTTHVPSPRSLTRSLFQIGSEDSQYTQYMGYLSSSASLRIGLSVLAPRTVLLVQNEGFRPYQVDETTVAEVLLENMIFEKIYSCNQLRNLQGQNIVSMNNRTWTIDINVKNEPCLTASGGGDTACITKCDLVGKNGIAHQIDLPLAQAGALSLAPSTPTPVLTATKAPALSPTTPWDFNVDICLESLRAGDADGDGAVRRPEFYGFLEDYSRRKCLSPMADRLSEQEITLFESLACQCLKEEDASPDCCFGTTAFVDLRGFLIADQDAYQAEVCRRVDRYLGEDLCTLPPSVSPSGQPSSEFISDPTGGGKPTGTDKEGTGDTDGAPSDASILFDSLCFLSAFLTLFWL